MGLLERRARANAKREAAEAKELRELQATKEAEQQAVDQSARTQELRQSKWTTRASWAAVLMALVAVFLTLWGQWSNSKDMAAAVAQIGTLAAASRDQAKSSEAIAGASADQLIAAAEQVRTSQEIARAAQIQAQAAQDAIGINRESLRIAGRELLRSEAREREQQTPRLEPVSIKLVRLVNEDRPVVDVELVNHGTTSALDVSLLSKFSTRPDSKSEDLGEMTRFGSVDRQATFQVGDGMPQSQLKVRDNSTELRFETSITFQDFLGRTYKQDVCARMAGPIEIGQEFRPCSKGGFIILPPCCQPKDRSTELADPRRRSATD